MSKELSNFAALVRIDGIYTAQKGDLRCSAVRLRSGGLCLYSPVVGLGAAALDSLNALGDVTHLLAPNHYHNKGIAEYAEAFPSAVKCCTADALPRLVKQTGLSFVPLQEAGLDLPTGTRLIEPKGLKTGEIWIDVAVKDVRVWIVTDAFRGPKAPPKTISDRPELLGTFPTYGIANKQVYFDWLEQTARETAPNMLLPCHGSIVSNKELFTNLTSLVGALL